MMRFFFGLHRLMMALLLIVLLSSSRVCSFSVSSAAPKSKHPRSSSSVSKSALSLSSKSATQNDESLVLHNGAPRLSPATHLPNQFYTWKQGLQIRYQCAGPVDGAPVLLVHGLFVNADHWRKSLLYLADAGYRAYAVDLLGYGYSDKPAAESETAHQIDGEVWRFEKGGKRPSVLRDIPLGTAQGGTTTRIKDVELRHPLHSCYNFFTWSDLLTSFSRDVILNQDDNDHNQNNNPKKVTLVANSIGTISSLQAVMDTPDLYTGVFSIAPNFRELHSAEVALPFITMPLLRAIQAELRAKGQPVYDALTKPFIIEQILKEPYARTDQVDKTLVQVLLDPLLIPGASKVVFDTLSYSAGPLPEQQLGNGSFPPGKPVWICYGQADPWTPGPRVEALKQKPPVERVVALPGVGHCPHDEAPELVHPLLLEFLDRVQAKPAAEAAAEAETSSSSSSS